MRERGFAQRAEVAEVIGRRPHWHIGFRGDPAVSQPGESPAGDHAPGRVDDRLPATGGVARTAFGWRGQCAPAMFSVRTPMTISPTPTIFATVIGEPRNSTAMKTMAAVPMADHSAYATSVCMPREMDMDSRTKETVYPTTQASVGHSRVKPSVLLSRLVATTSAKIAQNRNRYATTTP